MWKNKDRIAFSVSIFTNTRVPNEATFPRKDLLQFTHVKGRCAQIFSASNISVLHNWPIQGRYVQTPQTAMLPVALFLLV